MGNSGRGGWIRCGGWGKRGNEGAYSSITFLIGLCVLDPGVTMSTTALTPENGAAAGLEAVQGRGDPDAARSVQ